MRLDRDFATPSLSLNDDSQGNPVASIFALMIASTIAYVRGRHRLPLIDYSLTTNH